jgi:hypothetical protein
VQERCKLSGKSVAGLLKPLNLDESEKLFHQLGRSPVFVYATDVSHVFKRNSVVDFSFERLAELIITRPDSDEPSLASSRMVSGREVLVAMTAYVKLLGVENHVVFRPVINSLALANVLKPGSSSSDRRLIISYNPDVLVPESLVPGICAHELGTHLLRMLNDDLQVWRGPGRKTYRLSPHMATEEGLATLNTLVAAKELSLRHSALNYWAVCQGARLSFSDLFKSLTPFMSDPTKRFRLCVRVKRGLVNTEKPGACTLDQNYFVGAVDILRKLNITDLRMLYCGQISRSDLSRLRHLVSMHDVRLPPFLASPAAYEQHIEALHKIRRYNGIS